MVGFNLCRSCQSQQCIVVTVDALQQRGFVGVGLHVVGVDINRLVVRNDGIFRKT